MKITELFTVSEFNSIKTETVGSSAIFQASRLFDMVEDHLPENTRVWQIQWVMNEDGTDDYRPQFIFAKTKNEAVKKFNERMKNPSMGHVAIESIKEISFEQLNEGEVIKFPSKDKRSDAEKYDDSLENQTGNRSELGTPCVYCGDAWCNFDCDESQADGYDEDINEGDVVDFPGKKKGSNSRKYGDAVAKQKGVDPDGWDQEAEEKLHGELFGGDANKVGKKKFGKKNWTEGEVVDFPGKVAPINKNMSDQDKYDMALSNQKADQGYDDFGDGTGTVDNVGDPTKEEMTQVLNKYFGEEDMDIGREIAMYWFAADFHGGQSSNLYSALSMNEYTPGQMTRGIEGEDDELAQEMYKTLFDYFSSDVNEGKKKKKKKKKVKDAGGAWNKAEQYTKYDPPQTGNKGKSARAGFVG